MNIHVSRKAKVLRVLGSIICFVIAIYYIAHFAPKDTIRYITVTIQTSGNGTTIPAPGTYRIPFYASEDIAVIQAWKNGDTTTYGPPVKSTFPIEAIADPDWIFKKWFSTNLGGEFTTNKNHLVAGSNPSGTAYFVERVGLLELDLLSDLGDFLVEIGENTVQSDVYNLDTDWGDSYPDNGSQVFTGNGMPDAAEFALLEAVLKDVNLSMTDRAGIGHYFAWISFEANRAQAQIDLANESEAIQNAVAGYMTLGGYEYELKIKELIQTQYGVSIDTLNYRTQVSDDLAPKKDADNDGVSNLEEYGAVLATGRKKLSIFTANALDWKKKEGAS